MASASSALFPVLSTLDRQSHELYLRSRGRSYLQQTYRRLLAEGAESEERNGSGSLKRRRRDSDDSSTSTTSGVSSRLPHIDSVYRLELVPAKPEPSALVIGEPPPDVYLPSPSTLGSKPDQWQIVQTLAERAYDGTHKETENLFYDLDRLTHSQIKALAELEWEKELTIPVPTAPKTTDKRSSRKQAAATTAMAQSEEHEREWEMELIRRTFCDKARTLTLMGRASADW
ncbi:MAG: hypothetical protein CYPHOPRED_004458 [Cyphobasidiales sp. Tagirdzhanova-0007]|nr:MAG: hypothetical protein CYPHOPRED_004458 [Cyphobasidiales sp. Tagirdzhanova-0007]